MDPLYDIGYDTTSSIAGPYTKNNDRLITTGEFGLTSSSGGGCGDLML